MDEKVIIKTDWATKHPSSPYWTFEITLNDLKSQLTKEQIRELGRENSIPQEIEELNYGELCVCDYADTDKIIDHILTLAKKQNETIQAVNLLRKKGE